jgi:Arc/MetJ family transcription regulator
MKFKNKAKTQIDIDRPVWADLKRFATLKSISTSAAVQSLLTEALKTYGSTIRTNVTSAGLSFQTNQQTLSQEAK